MTNEGDRGSNSGYNSIIVAGLNQSSNHCSSMHAQCTAHHVCPHCKISLTTPQGVGSHRRVHKEINLQQEASKEGRIAVLALPALTTSPKSIKNQEAFDNTQFTQGKMIQETGQQQNAAIEDQKAVLPLFFMNSAAHKHEGTNGDFDWSHGGHSYVAPSNLHIEQLDPETTSPQTNQSDEYYPHFVDFMNILKHAEEMNRSSENKITNLELMESRQVEQGQNMPTVNTDLTLNPEGIDLTLRL